ncbi:MAG: YicC family protein [Prevotellaceae bacterium]|nr:YicC family protein [Prevotellaceae bacterium]
MIKSMTGFGKVECTLADKTISIAIRSINSKQFDAVFRLPFAYRNYESDFRNELIKVAQRGKIDVSITYTMNAENAASNINSDVVIAYFNQLQQIADKTGIDVDSPNILQAILSLPGVFNIDENVENEEEKKAIFAYFSDALNKFNTYREQEGAALIADILNRVENIKNLLLQVEPFEKERINQIKIRIENLINEFIPDAQIDKNRFEQELIYYLEKLDVTEEKVRLKQHCEYFCATAKEENPGRKITFICQEMGREINTLGSKANEVNIQRIVVQMKDELEKIKEQVLNIL